MTDIKIDILCQNENILTIKAEQTKISTLDEEIILKIVQENKFDITNEEMNMFWNSVLKSPRRTQNNI
jgi:hypothetical protein